MGVTTTVYLTDEMEQEKDDNAVEDHSQVVSFTFVARWLQMELFRKNLYELFAALDYFLTLWHMNKTWMGAELDCSIQLIA